MAFMFDLSTESAAKSDASPATGSSDASDTFVIKQDAPAAKQRLAFSLTTDGRIDLDGMRDKTRKQLADVLKRDTQSLRELGVITDKQSAAKWADEFVDGLYTSLGGFEAFAMTMLKKIPLEVTSRVMCYTQEEKNQLREPTKDVLSKYAPAKIASFQSETQLVVALFTMHIAKLAQLDEWWKQRQAEHRQAQHRHVPSPNKVETIGERAQPVPTATVV